MIDPTTIRWYKDWDIALPSVTSILRLAPVPQFIQSWQERIGLQAYNEHIDKILQRGTAIHKVCENFFLKTNNPIPTDYELQWFITGFYTFVAKFWTNISPTFDWYKIEEKIASKDFGYAGTIDFICKFFGKNTLIDWKTSSSSSLSGEMANNYGMQVVAYAMLWNYLYPKNQIDQCMIVVLTNKKKDGLWETMLVHRDEFKYYFDQFIPYVLFMNSVYNDRIMDISFLSKLW